MINTLVDLSNSSVKFGMAKDQLLFTISHGLSEHQCHDSLLQMLLPVASILLLNVYACCAAKVHTKYTPKKDKILTLHCCHPQDVPRMRRSGDPVERTVTFRCGVSIHQAGWGGLEQGKDALEMEDSKTHGGRVATSIPETI